MGKDTRTYTITRRGKRVRRPLPRAVDGFRLREQGSLTLITPEGRADWREEWRIMRSLCIDRNGDIVSLGLPKFFDADRAPEDAADADADLAAGRAEVTRKLDGRLLIRYCRRGAVQWRTRADFGAESVGVDLAALRAAHPALDDAESFATHSLLFEFRSPATRVILPVAAPSLTLIGAVDHADAFLEDRATLTEMATQLGVPLVEAIDPPRSLAALTARVEADALDYEGVVVRYDGGQRLVRVKSRAYHLAHRMRFTLHPSRIVSACERGRGQPETKLLARLGIGADDALIGYVREVVRRWSEAPDAAARDAVRADPIPSGIGDLAAWGLLPAA